MSSSLMQGFPPAPDAQVDLGNWRTPPFNRWAYSHVSEIVPSALIYNRPESVQSLPEKPVEIQSFAVEDQGKQLSFQEWLAATYTDGIVVLKNGAVIYEQYFGELKRETPHILMSISKSFTALVAGVLAKQGILNVDSRIDGIIPEIKNSAYAGATVRNLLDMRVGVDFEENYLASDGKIIEYRKAQNWNPLNPGDSARNLREFFPILKETDGEHNQRFHYASPNTDLLGWVLERVSGKRFADLAGELIWKPLGAEQLAYITVDRTGAPRCAGGICTTTRDLARLGRLFATGGQANGVEVVPESWLQDILTADTREAWDTGDFYDFYNQAPMHYRSKWYVEHGEHKMVFGLGVFGQNVFVEPENDLVIAKFSSQPLPLDQDFNTLTHKGINRLRELLR
ncbi:CubicO group peptidase (beta-lactamase class C family) [Neisseria sp. HSC-16F19]|nr:serine hydrolase [Neisseria sp. HSC-16F19]MCP2041486.1 CubicO group peptidase (beta-lactamase class C family) [Neisseria sp. HSC-16F19]